MHARFRSTLPLAAVAVFLLALAAVAPAAEPIDVGSRLELFVDDALLGELSGDVKQIALEPKPGDVVFVADQPWEGNTSGYYTVFQDGDIYRMIYRGWQHDREHKEEHDETTCYAESKDGIHWTKPKLGLFEWEGSKENNIVWLGPGAHNFTAFRDDNPAAPVDQRYKALGSIRGGLLAFVSPDCQHWKQLQEKPVITNGYFDSQNLAFWDAERKEYRAYWRYFDKSRVRAIRTATSQDFVHWENEADLAYLPGTPNEHLYTNAVMKYFRAPHLFIGFPTRFEAKSEEVEPVFMASRDGVTFKRYPNPVIPRTAPQDRNHNRSNYMVWGLLELPDDKNGLTVYGTENYYEATPGRVRRFTYRVDGFVALRGGETGGQVTTKPLRYSGEKLLLNFQTREGGSVQVELLDSAGKVLGLSKPMTGDVIDQPVLWDQTPRLGEGVGQLRLTLKNADVFAFRFQ